MVAVEETFEDYNHGRDSEEENTQSNKTLGILKKAADRPARVDDEQLILQKGTHDTE